jgi:hypothetical protein
MQGKATVGKPTRVGTRSSSQKTARETFEEEVEALWNRVTSNQRVVPSIPFDSGFTGSEKRTIEYDSLRKIARKAEDLGYLLLGTVADGNCAFSALMALSVFEEKAKDFCPGPQGPLSYASVASPKKKDNGYEVNVARVRLETSKHFRTTKNTTLDPKKAEANCKKVYETLDLDTYSQRYLLIARDSVD